VQRAQDRIPRRPISTFFVGLGVSVLFAALVALLGNANLAPLAIVLSSFALGWSLLGVSALARHVGSRLASPSDPAWKPHLRGGIVLALSFLVPLLGWLLLFPIALILGAGAITTVVIRRAPAPATAPVSAPQEAVKEEVLA
jgi:hypothetical protein